MKKFLLVFFVIAIIVVVLAGAFFGVTAIRFYYSRPIKISGDSMVPTLESGTLKHVNTKAKLSYYDVAVFFYDETLTGNPKGEYYDKNSFLRCMPIFGLKIKENFSCEILVKRIVGVAGDVIELRAETIEDINFIFLYRNGEKVIENIVMLNRDNLNAATRAYAEQLTEKGGFEATHGVRPTDPYVVPDGCYFVLGDNRDNSKDSRSFPFGAVPERYFLGVIK